METYKKMGWVWAALLVYAIRRQFVIRVYRYQVRLYGFLADMKIKAPGNTIRGLLVLAG